MEPSEESVRKSESKARKVSVNSSTKDQLVSVQYVSSSCLKKLECFFREAEAHLHRMSEDIQALDERRVVLADLEEQHTYQDIISQSKGLFDTMQSAVQLLQQIKDTFLDAAVVEFPSEKPTLATYHLWHPWFIMTEDDPLVMIPSIRVGFDHSQSETTISSTCRDKSTSLVRFQPDRCRMEGVLCKWTNPIEGWRYRFFVLDDVLGKLHYFTSKQKLLRGEHRGSVTLRRARVLKDEVDQSAFSIAVDRRVLYLQARDPNEREAWMEALQSAIDEQNISKNDSDGDQDPKEQCTSSSSQSPSSPQSPTQSAINTSEDRGIRMENNFANTTLGKPDRDSNLDIDVIRSLICWNSALDYTTTEVLAKLRLQVSQKMIEDLAGAVPGAVEQLLVELYRHIMHNNSPTKGEIKSSEQKMALAKKDKEMKEKEEAIYMLNSKVALQRMRTDMGWLVLPFRTSRAERTKSHFSRTASADKEEILRLA
uniref:PH domain-containing protein n=1 Tax=Timema poppense TaxID=170557 RepID=A0A7R9D5L0_TIMPO|nr:unnamed protein product [Timema poppensis]